MLLLKKNKLLSFIKIILTNGLNGGDCLETFQTNFYGVRRFFDIPCPEIGFDQYGREKTFGFMPYKYCGSKEDFAQVRVFL